MISIFTFHFSFIMIIHNQPNSALNVEEVGGRREAHSLGHRPR